MVQSHQRPGQGETERAMAGQPDAERLTSRAINDQLHAFKAELQRANREHDGSVEAKQRVALAQERMWNQQALKDLEDKDMDSAAKASREAVRHGELAVKLAKSRINDRVSLLERTVAEGQRKGRGIAEAARDRKESRK
jgi:hypothetical protein